MKKTILIGVSIVTVLAILLAAAALGFGDTSTKFNAFKAAEADNTSASAPPEDKAALEAQANNEISEIAIKGAIQQAQSNVSFRILEPMYIPSGYKFESVGGTKFVGAANDIDMASFSYKNGDEQFTIKEVIFVNIWTQPRDLPPEDTREIVKINGIEGRYSLENGIKSLSWKIGNLSLFISSWKNEGQNRTSSSLSKEEMIIIAKSVREKTPEEAIAAAQAEVSFKILQPSYIPEGYRMNTAQTSGTKFRGFSLEAEQASIFYINGDEFFMKNEYLNLQELLVLKDDTATNLTAPKTPWKYVDINGVQGRFLETSDGVKQLSWEIGNLNLTIGSHAYKESYSQNESGFTGTSLSKEEMIKMARSIK